jgi:probable rRNA maturation factor
VTRGEPERTRSIYRPPWRLDVTTRAGVHSPVPAAKIAASVAAALGAAGAPAPASIGLILSNDRELAELNRRHMGESGATDVLSFPLLPPEAFPPHTGASPAPPPIAARQGGAGGAGFALPPGRRTHLGDIVISIERAIAQAASGRGGQTGDIRWSTADEVLLLAVHGTLHVCGWDHAVAEEESAMRNFERRLLGDQAARPVRRG